MLSAKNIAVVNTSPIIYLSAINQINLLKRLFSEIFIPEAVKREVIFGGKDSFGVKEIKTKKWIKTKAIRNELAKEYLRTELDYGEAEVIILAEELKSCHFSAPLTHLFFTPIDPCVAFLSLIFYHIDLNIIKS